MKLCQCWPNIVQYYARFHFDHIVQNKLFNLIIDKTVSVTLNFQDFCGITQTTQPEHETTSTEDQFRFLRSRFKVIHS